MLQNRAYDRSGFRGEDMLQNRAYECSGFRGEGNRGLRRDNDNDLKCGAVSNGLQASAPASEKGTMINDLRIMMFMMASKC